MITLWVQSVPAFLSAYKALFVPMPPAMVSKIIRKLLYQVVVKLFPFRRPYFFEGNTMIELIDNLVIQ